MLETTFPLSEQSKICKNQETNQICSCRLVVVTSQSDITNLNNKIKKYDENLIYYIANYSKTTIYKIQCNTKVG